MKLDSDGRTRIADSIKQAAAQNSVDIKGCEHILQIQDVIPSANGCEDCLKSGDEWVNLRLCCTCGYVGCCDSSKNKHATRHYHENKHPLIISFEDGENWLWCYQDEVVIEP